MCSGVRGANDIRSYLKKVFWPNLGVRSGFQILDIPEYACGLKPGSAYILDQNPFFEMAYRTIEVLLGSSN